MTHARTVDLADIVATGDIARMFHVGIPTVCTWKTRYDDFPAPILTPSSGPLYLRSEVLAWRAGRWPQGS